MNLISSFIIGLVQVLLLRRLTVINRLIGKVINEKVPIVELTLFKVGSHI